MSFNLEEFKNKPVVVWGMGEEGVASTLFLKQYGLTPTVIDERTKESIPEETREILEREHVSMFFGPASLKKLSNVSLIVRSPGVSSSRAELARARKDGTVVTSQTKLFFELCPSPIVGITGTKGKGTTSTLLAGMLAKTIKERTARKGSLLERTKSVFLAGNMGGRQSPLSLLGKLKKNDLVILELSSFQLEDMAKSPTLSIVLEIFPDHLDHHKNIAHYVAAKSNILRFQKKGDSAIVSIDSHFSNGLIRVGNGEKITLSRTRTNTDISLIKKFITINWNGKRVRLCDVSKSKLLGRHNAANIGAAAGAAFMLGAKPAVIAKEVASFKGLPHRLQLVAKRAGIAFYDDSIATIPEASYAAVRAFDSPVVLLVGGKSKGVDYRNFAKALCMEKYLHAVIGFGHSGPAIVQEIKKAGFKGDLEVAGTEMVDLFKKIKLVARKGDSVLLSPAATSYDAYRNYKERGEVFAKYANKY